MKPTVIIRPRAQADIDECAAFIATGSVEAAHRFLTNAERTLKETALFPKSGSPRVSARKSLAEIYARPIVGFRNYLVFYRILKGGNIRVVRVLHGARDVATMLRLVK